MRREYKESAMSTSRRRKVFGVGVNDADYTVKPTTQYGRLACPAYKSWINMLMRAFSESYQNRQPTYAGSSICEEWLSFMSYRAWWESHYKQGWHLDKDFINPGNKHYHPDNCIFIPQWLSNIVSGHDAGRSRLGMGVSLDIRSNAIIARYTNPTTRKKVYLGSFETAQLAADAYQKAKIEAVMELKPIIDAIDERLLGGVLACIKSKTKPA